jgi:hypothetical protein
MSAIPIKLSDDWLDYSTDWTSHEPVLQRHSIVSKSKNTFNQIMNKPSMNQLLEIKEKIGKFFWSMKRMAYYPKTALSVTLLAAALAWNPQEAKAQCCGLDYTMFGGWVWYESTRDDYYANKDNWRTRDGVWYHLAIKWQNGHMRYEIIWATATHTKYQDADNRYKAYFPRIGGGIWYSPSDAEARLVIYGQLDGGWIRTIMKWSRQFPGASDAVNGKPFHYSQINPYVWWTLWVEINIDERFKIALTGNLLMIPNGKLDNIKGGAVTPDFKWGAQVGMYFILY